MQLLVPLVQLHTRDSLCDFDGAGGGESLELTGMLVKTSRRGFDVEFEGVWVGLGWWEWVVWGFVME